MSGGQGTVVIGTDATTWSKTYELLGVPYYANERQGTLPAVRVNGVVTNASWTLRDGDVVVLNVRKEDATGPYNYGVAVTLPETGGEERELSGFSTDKPITKSRVKDVALLQACSGVRWDYYNHLQTGNDLMTAGCNYPTAIKISYADTATLFCAVYDSAVIAYQDVSERLAGSAYLAVFVGPAGTDVSKMCK